MHTTNSEFIMEVTEKTRADVKVIKLNCALYFQNA